MTPTEIAVVIVVAAVFLAGSVVTLRGKRKMGNPGRINRDFLAAALVSENVVDGRARAMFRATSNERHALWLDLRIASQEAWLGLGVRIIADGKVLIEEHRGVGIDWEADTENFPEAVVVLNMSGASGVYRTYTFVPPAGATVEVAVTVTPDEETELSGARVLVTCPDVPSYVVSPRPS